MKKVWALLISFLLVLLLMFTTLPMVSAAPTLHLETEQYNPYTDAVEEPAVLSKRAPLYFSGANLTYHTDLESAAAIIRDAMEAREKTVTVGYAFPGSVPSESEQQAWLNDLAFDQLLEQAFAETDNATEGDSLRLGYRSASVSASFSGTTYTKMAITYTFTYYTTAAQEAELTAAVDALIDEFNFNSDTTEREKVDTIYRWLCDNITYDYTSTSYLKHSAYAAMINKTAVCQGYAVLFYRLAEEVGLDARIITGTSSSSDGLHGWNIVQLGDRYYYLDATWDAEKEPADYDYYLKGTSDFYGHINDKQFETKEFTTRYPIAPTGKTESSGLEVQFGDWEVSIVGERAIITKYTGQDTHVVVPAFFNLADYQMGSGILTVESVATEALSNSTIESITIREGVRHLGINAIAYCGALKELHLPSSLQLRSYGFTSFTEVPYSCDQLETITVASGNPYLTLIDGVLYTADLTTVLYCPPKRALTTLTLPDGVVAIGNSAFASHDTLEQVTLPASMREIGYFAFQSNTALKTITLNEGLDRIGQYAFSACGSLDTIHIPATVTTILDDAFYDTPLCTITVDAENDVFSVQGGMLIGDGKVHKFALSNAGDTVVIPEGVTAIVNGAFEGASFRAVTLPSTLKTIGQTAFSDCKDLIHVTIPPETTTIGSLAFSGCDMLISAVIPASVTQIGDSIFHLGPPETYVTVYGEAGSVIQRYCSENEIAFRLLDSFLCGNGHTVEKVTDDDLSTTYIDVWHWECAVCGCATRPFSKSYHSMGDATISYAVDSTTHIYDGTRFTPAVLWVKHGDTVLTEGVDYYVQYEDNRVPGGVNALHIWGMGEFRGDRYVQLTIRRAPITNAIAVLNCYEFEYSGDPCQPWVNSLTLNGQLLNYGTDYVIAFENNVEAGTGYVAIHGNGYYTDTVRVPFTIREHQHSWSGWFSADDTKHGRRCNSTSCAYFNTPYYADHQYDNEHDEQCNDCGHMRVGTHSFTTRYGSDDYSHWLICDGCDKQRESYGHHGGEATCIARAVCIDCGRSYGEIGSCRWDLKHNASQHWYECNACHDTKDHADHSGGTASCTAQKRCDLCGTAYGELSDHNWYWTGDTKVHWEACYYCDATQHKANHQGGNATCGSLNVCTVCQLAYGEPVGHSGGQATCTSQAYCQYCATPYGSLASHEWVLRSGTAQHWQGCKHCTATKSRTNHSGGKATCKAQAKCTVCNKAYGEFAKHIYTSRCDTTCNTCGAKRTISHSYKKVITKATLTKNGKISYKCSVCCYVSSNSTVIKRIASLKLSTSAYTYNGVTKMPSVTVKDTAGKVLKKNTDYTVSYESGRKLPGKYTVKVTFKGNYSGSKSLYFTIAPKAVTGLKATQTTSSITLKWNKATGAVGYRIYQYNSATKKYVALKNVTAASTTISKLKAGTGYTFKVRAYDKDGDYIYSAYSAAFATATKPKTPTLTASSATKGKMTLRWTNVTGESGYQVYYATAQNGTYKKLAAYGVNVAKKTVSMTRGKTYYVKVRAYKKTASGTIYSAFSTVKKVKIK